MTGERSHQCQSTPMPRLCNPLLHHRRRPSNLLMQGQICPHRPSSVPTRTHLLRLTAIPRRDHKSRQPLQDPIRRRPHCRSHSAIRRMNSGHKRQSTRRNTSVAVNRPTRALSTRQRSVRRLPNILTRLGMRRCLLGRHMKADRQSSSGLCDPKANQLKVVLPSVSGTKSTTSSVSANDG